MPRYLVQHAYASNHNGRRFGPWEKGAEIEVDSADAEWVNRDSPSTLAEAKPAAAAKPAPAKRPGRPPKQEKA